MTYVWFGLAIIGTILAIAFLLNLLESITFFKKELRHLNGEIGRTSGRERAYWKKRKKCLLLSIIPFVKY